MKNYHPTDDLDDQSHPAYDSRFSRNDPRPEALPQSDDDGGFGLGVLFALTMIAIPLAPIIFLFFFS